MNENSTKKNKQRKVPAKRELANTIIRKELAKTGVFRWELADLLGVSVETVQRMLRHELSEDEQHTIVNLIREYSEGE